MVPDGRACLVDQGVEVGDETSKAAQPGDLSSLQCPGLAAPADGAACGRDDDADRLRGIRIDEGD